MNIDVSLSNNLGNLSFLTISVGDDVGPAVGLVVG